MLHAEDGYRLWLRYDKIDNSNLMQQYRTAISYIQFARSSPTLDAAKKEMLEGLQGLLNKKITLPNKIENGTILVGTAADLAIYSLVSKDAFNKIGEEGFIIKTAKSNQKNIILIAANTDVGVLYGCFHFLRLLQTHQNIQRLSIISSPLVKLRMLDHWDNINRTVERGYAGMSLWNWHNCLDIWINVIQIMQEPIRPLV